MFAVRKPFCAGAEIIAKRSIDKQISGQQGQKWRSINLDKKDNLFMT
jgi:hypothetical protein